MFMQEPSDPVPEDTGTCCPGCGSAREVIPVVYAFPTPDLRAAQRKGKVIIFNPPGGPHSWYCKNCGTGGDRGPLECIPFRGRPENSFQTRVRR